MLSLVQVVPHLVPSLEEVMSKKTYSGQLRLRMPPSLHRELTENAEREGVSLNTLLIYLISRNLNVSAKDVGDFIRKEEGVVSIGGAAPSPCVDCSVILIDDSVG
jgi:hypothetical protein